MRYSVVYIFVQGAFPCYSSKRWVKPLRKQDHRLYWHPTGVLRALTYHMYAPCVQHLHTNNKWPVLVSYDHIICANVSASYICLTITSWNTYHTHENEMFPPLSGYKSLVGTARQTSLKMRPLFSLTLHGPGQPKSQQWPYGLNSMRSCNEFLRRELRSICARCLDKSSQDPVKVLAQLYQHNL